MLATDSGFVVKEREYVILLLYVNTEAVCDSSYTKMILVLLLRLEQNTVSKLNCSS